MAHAEAGRMVQSDTNNTDEVRMLGTIHDTGLIGIGTINIKGKWSAELWTPEAVRDHAHELIALCDLAEGKVTMDELRERATSSEEE